MSRSDVAIPLIVGILATIIFTVLLKVAFQNLAESAEIGEQRQRVRTETLFVIVRGDSLVPQLLKLERE